MKIISFTGGYGAQIISAAAYFHLEKINTNNVGAYFGYFSQTPHQAVPGVKNDISHWKWEMHNFGIKVDNFYQPTVNEKSEVVWDGPEKGELGFSGLREPDIASKFIVSSEAVRYKKEMFGAESYACLHIRRGDYLNVASYLVSDEAFLRVTKKITKLVKNLLIVSDTPLNSILIQGLSALNINCVTAIGGEPHLVHGLMRLSDILICSNSQFSLTAAALRDDSSLTLYPSQHDGEAQSYSNKFLSSIREFQIITML